VVRRTRRGARRPDPVHGLCDGAGDALGYQGNPPLRGRCRFSGGARKGAVRNHRRLVMGLLELQDGRYPAPPIHARKFECG
jgi:hypothetical protein